MAKELSKAEEILKLLTDRINDLIKYGGDMDATSYGYEEGVLISGNEAKLIIELLKTVK